MNIEEIKHDILMDIMSTEEGKHDIIDYANGKINDARELLSKYENIFRKRTGNQINLSERYLDTNIYYLTNKQIPKIYEQWKSEGTEKSIGGLCLAEEIFGAVKNYKEPERSIYAKSEVIEENISNLTSTSKTNNYVANKIADMIREVLQDAKYYSAGVLSSEIICEDLAEEILYEMRSIISSVRPEEIEDILRREKTVIIRNVSKTLEKTIEQKKTMETKEELKGKEQIKAFKDSIKVDGIDYSKIYNSQKTSEEKQVDTQKTDKKPKELPSDFIID